MDKAEFNKLRPIGQFGIDQRDRALLIFRNGVAAQNAFNHGKAVSLFERAYQSDKSFVLALYEKCWSYISVGRFSEAADSLRVVINRYRDMGENYVRIGELNAYKREKTPESGPLFSLYEDLTMLDALLTLGKDHWEGMRQLRAHIDDPLIPSLGKSVVNGFLAGIDLPGVKQRPSVELRRQVARSLQALIISCNHFILAPLEELKDLHAMGIQLKAQLKVVEGYLHLDKSLKGFRRNIQMALAGIHYQTRALEECRKILESLQKEDPDFEDAKLLLQEMTKFN